MSNSRLEDFLPSAKQVKSLAGTKNTPTKQTTYKQPTKGIKLTQLETENLEKLTKRLRVETQENVTDNKTIRALTYLANDEKVVKALREIILKQLS